MFVYILFLFTINNALTNVARLTALRSKSTVVREYSLDCESSIFRLNDIHWTGDVIQRGSIHRYDRLSLDVEQTMPRAQSQSNERCNIGVIYHYEAVSVYCIHWVVSVDFLTSCLASYFYMVGNVWSAKFGHCWQKSLAMEFPQKQPTWITRFVLANLQNSFAGYSFFYCEEWPPISKHNDNNTWFGNRCFLHLLTEELIKLTPSSPLTFPGWGYSIPTYY